MRRTRSSGASIYRAAVIGVALGLLLPSISLGAPQAPATTGKTTATADTSVRAPSARLTASSLSIGTPRKTHGRATVLPFRTMSPGALRAAQLRATAHASVGQRTPQTSVQLPAAGLFNGLNQPGLSDYAVTPPDTTGAVGPTRYLEFVNQQVGVYDRSNLGQISQTDLTSFVGGSATDIVSDPQIQWDGQAGRWLYAAVVVAQGDNALAFGWSKTADPSDLTNGWCRFGIGRGSDLDDYPKLGHDNDYILVGSNVYTDTVPNYAFETAAIFAIPKPAAGDTSCAGPSGAWVFGIPSSPLLNQDGSQAYTPVPANTADASSSGYVVAAHTPLSGDNVLLGPQDKLMLWHVVVNGSSPGLVADGDLMVPTFNIPASAPQPGSANTLDTLDGRLTQAVAVNDPTAGGAKGIWTQHTVDGPGGRSVVHWYEIVGGATPFVRQHGEVSSPTDFVFNAAISPAIGGDSAAIFYNRAGTTQLPVIAGLARGPATPLGAMDSGELLLGSSTAVDVDPSCAPPQTPCRWGDYSGATPDPVNPGVVWGSNQVTGPCFIICGWFSQWQTRNFAVVTTSGSSATVPSAPRSLTATPGDATVSLAWSAPASNGGAPVSNYEIYRGTASGGEAWVAEVGNVLTYSDGGRTNGTTYYYTVTAKNAVGEGPPSNEASATPQAPPPPPVPPSAPTLTSATPGNGQVSLTWTAPSSDGGAPITNYVISRSVNSGGETFLVMVGNVLSYVDAGLTNGTTYFYTVAALNSAGTGGSSNELSATPANPDFSVLATPDSRSIGRGGTATYTVTVTPSGGFSGSVSFSASISPKGKGVTTSFSPPSITLPGSTSSTLTVKTTKATAHGTYTITITATGGGQTHTATVTLALS